MNTNELQTVDLSENLANTLLLVNDTVMKDYVTRLSEFPVLRSEEPVQKSVSGQMQFFRIAELVYEKNEFAVHKLVSVFHTLSSDPCTLALLIHSNGHSNAFYLGVRADSPDLSTGTMKTRLADSLQGNFAGSKIEEMMAHEFQGKYEQFFSHSDSVSSVTCVPDYKRMSDTVTNQDYIQGLEKFIQSMNGKAFTAVILANNVSYEMLMQQKREYERIYTLLSPFAEMQLNLIASETSAASTSASVSFGKGETRSTSISKTTGTGESRAETLSEAKGTAHTTSNSFGDSFTTSKSNTIGFHSGINISPSFLGTSVGGINFGVSGSHTSGTSHGVTHSKSVSDAVNDTLSHGFSRTEQRNQSESKGYTAAVNDTFQLGSSQSYSSSLGSSKGITLHSKNRTIQSILEKLDKQIKRMDECESMGMWQCAAYFLGDNADITKKAANNFYALMSGNETGVERSAIHTWFPYANDRSRKQNQTEARNAIRDSIKQMQHPAFLDENYTYQDEERSCSVIHPTAMISTNELAILMGLPRHSVKGLPVIEHAIFSQEVLSVQHGNLLPLGNIHHMGADTDTPLGIDMESLPMHTFITGSTGVGKSNTVYKLLKESVNRGIHFLVIEPAKGEYKHALCGLADISVYGTNPLLSPLLQINPFSFPKQIHVLEHIDRLVEIFNVCWPMYAAMPAVLKNAVEQSYADCGWNLISSENEYGAGYFPCFDDVVRNIRLYIDSSEYDTENKGAYKGSLLTRLQSLTNGINGMVFSQNEIPSEELFDKNVIVDLSRVGSVETKSLLMGMLVLKLQEYRMCESSVNAELKHLTVLEEAHHLLKRTSTEQSAESSNVLGKSVEMLSNVIAEMRTYGEGFIIVDQSPGLLDASVIRNTNTKIILRLPDQNDRELVGKAAGLNDRQINELEKLPCGVAAVYQNNWIEPVLCRISKAEISQERYQYTPETVKNEYPCDNCIQLVKYILNGRRVAQDILLCEIQPILRTINLNAYYQIAILKYLSIEHKKIYITQIAPMISHILPTLKRTVIESYKRTKEPQAWTEYVEQELLHFSKRPIPYQVRRDIIQAVFTDYFYNDLHYADELKDWQKRGELR